MIGKRIEQYEIVEEVGKGGMATVYRAYHPGTDRFVALKIIHRDLARDPEGAERFRREAQLISRLEHPHLLPVHDFSADYDPQYIVMRYLAGGSLKDVIESRLRLPLGEIAYLMRQVCSALEYAHRRDIIHRDIKPGNIMVDLDGNAYLTDFGVARVMSVPGFTQTGFSVGTPGYMSPEQSYGLDTVDHRSDIYSLGVMVFEMAVGSAPYVAPTPLAVLLKHLYDPIPSAQEQAADLPDGMDIIIHKAMAKHPHDRYSSANDLAEALVALAGSAAAGSTPVKLKATATDAVRRIEKRRDEDAIKTLLAKFERERAGMLPAADMPTVPVPEPAPKKAPAPAVKTSPDRSGMPLPAWMQQDAPARKTAPDRSARPGTVPARPGTIPARPGTVPARPGDGARGQVSPRTPLNSLVQRRWILALRGLAAVLFGWVVLGFEGAGISTFVRVFILYVVIDGLIAILPLFRRGASLWRWVGVLESTIAIIVVVLLLQFESLFVIQAWAVLTGIVRIWLVLQLRKNLPGKLWLRLSLVVSVLCGAAVLLMFARLESLSVLEALGVLTIVLSAYSIAFGLLLVMLSFRLREVYARENKPVSGAG